MANERPINALYKPAVPPQRELIAKERAPKRGSVFLCEHQGEHAGGLRGIGRVFRPILTLLVVGVDFPKELPAAQFEAAEITLPEWVVVFIEFVKGSELMERGALHHVGKGIDSGGHHDFAAGEAFAERVIKKRDLTRHTGLLNQTGEHES